MENHDAVADVHCLIDMMSDEDRGLAGLLDEADNSARRSRAVISSSEENGSSHNRISGSTANARAIETRWRMPPDSACG